MNGALINHLAILAGTCLTAVAAAYAWVAVSAVLRARRRAARTRNQKSPAPEPASSPPRPVSVLKPLCGDEPRLYENLRSFCVQSHPAFQLVFGLHGADDPASAVVRRLQLEFPERDIELVIDSRVHGTNLKVSNLVNMLPHARHGWLVLADSDVGVDSDYLERVTAPLADPGVGVVTCLYRGAARAGGWSRFGALFIDDWFVPSVQVAHLFASPRFSFGATIALRRETLTAIGGFEALNDRLADDFWLGELIRRRGFRTVLSDVIVDTDVNDRTLSDVWAHELRWMRTIRFAQPVGFALAFVTFPFPVLAVGLALARTDPCAAIAAIGALGRLLVYFAQRRGRLEPSPAYEVALVPWRDILLFAVWAAAHMGSVVRWRDQVFRPKTEQGASAEAASSP